MSALTIKKSIHINADAVAVFDAIADFEHYSQWNPWVIEAHGLCATGSIVTAVRRWFGLRFAAKHEITEVTFPEKMRWRGYSWFSSLVQVERERHVFPGIDGSTLYTVKVIVSGPLARLGYAVGHHTISQGMKAETLALKQLCETHAIAHDKKPVRMAKIRSVDLSGKHTATVI